MPVRIDGSFERIDWVRAEADLAADDFDNGRTPEALRRSFEQSQHVVFARDSDRVCNAYLLDVWTATSYRRRGVASAMVRGLMAQVPGQHVGLQTSDAQGFYRSLGFRLQPQFMSTVVGEWLEAEPRP
jgi:ribosomal protein S18 acetylase RimI-like enzyme